MRSTLVGMRSTWPSPRRTTLQVAGLLYGGEVRDHPEWLREHGHQRYVRQASTRGYVWQLLAGRRWTSWWGLPGLSHPTLVLSGDDDPIVPLVNARILARAYPTPGSTSSAAAVTCSCSHARPNTGR